MPFPSGMLAVSSTTEALSADREALLVLLIGRSIVRQDQERITGTDGRPSEWMVDTRVLLLDPVSMQRIGRLFLDAIKDFGSFQLACLEMTGIPLMAGIQHTALVEGRVINGLIIRKERKGSGRMRAIEGEPNSLPVIFVDDILNSAETFVQGMEVLRFNGLQVPLFWALVDFHRELGMQRVINAGCSLMTEFALEELGIVLNEPSADQSGVFPWHRTWQFRPGTSVRSPHVIPKSTPAVSQGMVHFGAENGCFYAVDAETGEERWSFQTVPSDKGIFSSPLLAEGAVVFGAYDGNVYCLDQATGSLRWKFVEADWVGSSPAWIGSANRIVIGLEHSLGTKQGSIVALDLKTGERAWECTVPGMVHGTPLYIEKHNLVCCGTNDAELLILEADTGYIRAILRLQGALKSSPAYDCNRDAIVFGDLSGKVYSYSLAESHVRWIAQTEDAVYSQPLLFGNKVLVAGTDRHIYTFSAEDGVLLRRTELLGKLFGGIRKLRDKLYVGSTSGRLYCLDAGSSEVMSYSQIHERITTPIGVEAACPDRFFLLTNDSVLSCFVSNAVLA